MMSGIWAAGEVKDLSQVEGLDRLLDREEKELKRNIPITLLKLGHDEHYEKVVDMILGADKGQAINVCYLSLRVEERILNELIIASIYKKGEDQRNLAIDRYAHCGGFCREQISLLVGKEKKFVI